MSNYLQRAKMKQRAASSLQTVALWAESKEWRQASAPPTPPPPHHPVISQEAGPEFVPIPSGRCHLSRVLPATLWLHHSATIVIKMVIFVWGNKRDYFFQALGGSIARHHAAHTEKTILMHFLVVHSVFVCELYIISVLHKF